MSSSLVLSLLFSNENIIYDKINDWLYLYILLIVVEAVNGYYKQS